MKQYRIFFINNETMTITEEELNALRKSQPVPALGFFPDNRAIALRHITHILPIEKETESKVITPKTPEELKSDQQRQEANRPVTLDDQLANPEVGQ